MGGNKQIISYESTVLWTQPSWGVSSPLDWFWWPWSCTCGWERRSTQESRDYHVYNNARATRLAVKGLGRRLHQEYRKMMKPFFFKFSLFVFWWSLMEKYLFTFRHWNWLSLSALIRTSVGNIFFRVGKKIISKKISHRKRKCLFPKQATENNQTEHLHCLILEKWSKRPSCFANLIQSYRAKSGLPGYRIPCMQHLSCSGLLSSAAKTWQTNNKAKVKICHSAFSRKKHHSQWSFTSH